MKIQALRRVYFGRTINLGNKEITFDDKGVAEVGKEHGEKILQEYPSLIGEFGVKIETPTNKIIDPQKDRLIEEMQERVDTTVHQMEIQKKKYEEEISRLNQEVDSWKKEYEKTQGGGMVNTDKALSSVDMLLKLSVEELRSTAKDMQFEEAEWGTMKQKELVLYLFGKILSVK